MNEKLEKIYIFDLDHTLFNAQKFREELGLIIANEKNVITEKIWKVFNNNDKRIIDFIEQESQKYLFPGVTENLKIIQGEKILLSFGNLGYQKAKIQALKMPEIFDDIIITDQNKINFLIDFYQQHQEEEIFFINDNYNKRFSENKEIAERIPQIKILEVDNYLPEKHQTISEVFLKLKKLSKN